MAENEGSEEESQELADAVASVPTRVALLSNGSYIVGDVLPEHFESLVQLTPHGESLWYK